MVAVGTGVAAAGVVVLVVVLVLLTQANLQENISLCVNYLSTIALQAILIEFYIARLKFK